MFSLRRGFLLSSSPSLLALNYKSALLLQSFGGKSSPARISSHLRLRLRDIRMRTFSWFTNSKHYFSPNQWIAIFARSDSWWNIALSRNMISPSRTVTRPLRYREDGTTSFGCWWIKKKLWWCKTRLRL